LWIRQAYLTIPLPYHSMAYDIKSVFYLDTSLALVNGAGGGASTQLDLSAYIDPIARGRSKGTGLAVYKTHFSVDDASSNDPAGVNTTETGLFRVAVMAGLGSGEAAVSAVSFANNTLNAANDLCIAGFDWFGADAFGTSVYSASPSMSPQKWMEPSEKVPYIIVRDNVCLVAEVGANLSSALNVSMRLECAQISLDQATLNQLLRTQTV
jgi:hypothetical protein